MMSFEFLQSRNMINKLFIVILTTNGTIITSRENTNFICSHFLTHPMDFLLIIDYRFTPYLGTTPVPAPSNPSITEIAKLRL